MTLFNKPPAPPGLPGGASEGTATGLWTSVNMVPTAVHPAVLAEGADATQTLLARQAYRHQAFTERLEDFVVMPETRSIIYGDIFSYPDDIVDAASVIGIEELEHANLARKLRRRMDDFLKKLNVPVPNVAAHAFIQKVLDAGTSASRGARLLKIGYTFVSETLITGALSALSHDRSLDSGVRAFSTLHFQQETVHHKFFASIFGTVWKQLSDEERDYIGGDVVPSAIVDYLRVDMRHFADDLESIGFQSCAAERILAESFKHVDLGAAMRLAARPTLGHMRRIAPHHPAVGAGQIRFNLK